MNDTLPLTPSSSNRTTVTPRHLKRLSLSSNGSPFSPNSPSSPLSNGSPGGATSLSRSDSGARRAAGGAGGSQRGLRLSMSGSGIATSPASTTASPLASSSRNLDDINTSPTVSRSSSYRASSSSLASPAANLPSSDSPSRTPRSAHSRRTSSISYSRSPTLGTGNSEAFTSTAPEQSSPNPNSAIPSRISLEGGRPRSSLEGLAEAREEEEEGATEGDDDKENRREDDDESINLGSGSALGFMNAQPTLTEQNSDLLSFIAKKERKCLDLREELKRHESELALLKKKWESIVARSFQRQQQQHQQQSSASSSSRHNTSQSISTISSASPNTSPTPRSHSTLHPASASHSLDLSLLSTTFDASDLLSTGNERQHGHSSNGSDPQIEIPESVKAAGNWLGAHLGRVLEAAVGMPPPAGAPSENEPLEGKRKEREGGAALESLIEEEEDEEEDGDEAKRRRESQASSTSTDTTSGSGGKESTAASSVMGDEGVSPLQAIKTSPLRQKPKQERSASPLATRRTERLYTSPPSSSSSAAANTFPPPSSSSSHSGSAPSTSPSHSRSKSSLASFSDGWSSINKRWTNLTESETFKNSKRATLGLVDTFEQGLAQALGPLEPPSLSPNPGNESNERRRSSIPSPFLSGSSPNPNHREGERNLMTDVPISPMPGQGLSSVFASWSKGKEDHQKKQQKEEVLQKDKGKGKDTTPNSNGNGFDWSAFQDQEEKKEEEVEEWPAW